MVTWLQRTCIVLCGWGIVVEFAFGADLGFLLITVGSLAFALATKIHALEEKNKRKD
ncbi:unnamed protein product [marine sediment metagenome]|uniref:Uncharacterized protein n=1 Tax=marine sediment metagenome TaxID=412755 RepID=X1D0E3_9ZZZZ